MSPSPAPIAVSALLLCGGKSRRFGQEKGLTLFAGEPLAARVLSALDAISTDVWVSANRPDMYAQLGRPIVKDLHPDGGPLAGLHAALLSIRHDLLAVAACDMPFVSVTLFEHMLTLARERDDWDVIVPTQSHASDRAPAERLRYQTLHAIYHRRCLTPIAALLDRGERMILRLYDQVRVREVPEEEWRALPGVDARVFENINTPEDARRLEVPPED
ncbi:molybdenum cofactor guanylyltransferase [Candidatus Eisenbacteria bacterium]|uniref:Probable molybdenum cofactor guanylyltransferase n=1 Tax=Eiseniibacteriota bacterium TaxID=2212470 RepID=A0ABV6YI43_UNCEI